MVNLIDNISDLVKNNIPIKEPVAVLALLTVILLVVPLLFKKFRIPSMAKLILTGAVIGPNGFDFLNFSGGLKLFSTIGLLYISLVREDGSSDMSQVTTRQNIFSSFSVFLLFQPSPTSQVLNLS